MNAEHLHPDFRKDYERAREDALSESQLAFLAFAVTRPKPFAWRWLNADGEISLGVETHRWFIARKMVRGVELQSCRLTVAEIDALAPYWSTNLLELNDVGAALLADAAREAA